MIVHWVFCFTLLFACALQGNVGDRRFVQGVNCRLVSGYLTGLGAGLRLWLGHGVWDWAWDMFRGTRGHKVGTGFGMDELQQWVWNQVDAGLPQGYTTRLSVWHTTVRKCSICGEAMWFFGRKGVFVGAYWFCRGPFRRGQEGGFLVQAGGFSYQMGVFWYLPGFFC